MDVFNRVRSAFNTDSDYRVGADRGVMEDDEIRLSVAAAAAVRTTAFAARVKFETGTAQY